LQDVSKFVASGAQRLYSLVRPNLLMGRLIILLVIILSSCTHVDKQDLIGEWYSIDSDGIYNEIWFSDGLVLLYYSAAGEIVLYKYSIDGTKVHFELIESYFAMPGKATAKILSLTKHDLSIRYLEPGQGSTSSYFKIPDSYHRIHSDLESNLEYLDELMKRTKIN
jgi:hypothetical protein